jgi:hypothetical protein
MATHTQCRSVAFAPNGLFVAVGIDGRGGKVEGSVFIVSLMEEQLRIVNRKQVRRSVCHRPACTYVAYACEQFLCGGAYG